MRVVAIIAAHNEADIIGQVVRDLVDQHILVYLIDHGSTDDTVATVQRHGGSGVLGIERVPADETAVFSLRTIIARKQELVREIEADWFINHDADEFRESPWSGCSLVEGIQHVDRLGYNAVDFEVIDFWPTGENFVDGDDPREVFRFCERGGASNRLQIRCWKNLGGPLDLVSSGGHEAVFPGREVFPIRFLLRHYPFRGQAHGERKLLRERRPRYDAAECAAGWHVQHEHLVEGASFIRDPAELTLFDPDVVRVRLQIENRLTEELAGSDVSRRLAEDSLIHERDLLSSELDLRNRELQECNRRLEGQTERAAATRVELDELRGSWSWRLTAPLRAVVRVLRGF